MTRTHRTESGETRTAVYSACELYRYTLEIVWDSADGLVQFIGLNPSTATELVDDPTIRRCKEFSRRWRYGGMIMTNLFAFRATDPRDLKAHVNSHSELGSIIDNATAIVESASICSLVVACWGNHGKLANRDTAILDILRRHSIRASAFRLTKAGQPEHPLYMPANTPLIPLFP